MLEINSKTGLYPLYVTYSIFRSRCAACPEEELDDAKLQQLWDAAVRGECVCDLQNADGQADHPAHTCWIPDVPVNAHYFDDLINMMNKSPRQFVDRV